MDKKEAAKKLIEMFGSVDAVGVAHSIVVEISKYVIILLFAVYTWHCFTVFFGKNAEKKRKGLPKAEQNYVCNPFYLFLSAFFKQPGLENCPVVSGTAYFFVFCK